MVSVVAVVVVVAVVAVVAVAAVSAAAAVPAAATGEAGGVTTVAVSLELAMEAARAMLSGGGCSESWYSDNAIVSSGAASSKPSCEFRESRRYC